MQYLMAGVSTMNSTVESTSVLNNLNSFRTGGVLCDVKLISKDGVEFLAHKSVLAANSWFFRKLFTQYTQDVNNNLSEFECEDISSVLLSIVLNCFYEQNVVDESLSSVDIVVELLIISNFLYSRKLLDFCCKKLSTLLNYRNALQIWKVADCYSRNELAEEAKLCVLQNFHMITPSGFILPQLERNFVQLPFEFVFDLFNDDRLNVRDELDIIPLIKIWINFDRNNRSKFLNPLLSQCVRYEMTKDEEKCKEIVSSNFLTVDEQYFVDFSRDVLLCNVQNSFYNVVQRYRLPRDLIFIMGGVKEGDPVNIVELFDNKSENLIVWPHDSCSPRPLATRMYHAMIELNNQIYLIGGYTGCEYFNSCCRFDPATKTWRSLASMIVSRCYVSAAVLNGFIYAMGGYDGETRLSSVEKYDIAGNQWSFVCSMAQPRNDASAVSMNGYIYVAGGFNSDDGVLCSVERYDPTIDKWSFVTPMLEPRCGLSLECVVTDDDEPYLVAVGGLGNASGRSKSVEKFVPHSNCWQRLPDMNVARSNFASVILDNYFYCFGGYDGVYNLNQVERFDLRAERWQIIAPLSDIRSASKACVISCLKNVQDFLRPTTSPCK